MRQTLFYIPDQIRGVPLFGVGLLLAVWAVVCAAMLVVLIRRHGFTADAWTALPVMGLMGVVIAVILPALAEPGYGLPVRGYGMMVLAGVVAGVWLAMRRARRAGIDPELIYSLAFWMCAAGIVGARLLYVARQWDQYRRDDWLSTLREVVNIPAGGLVVYGAVFGAATAFVVFVRRSGLPLLRTADIVGPGMLVGLALGRVGCFLNGCCFGGVCTDLPWAVTFPFGSPPFVQQAEQGAVYLHGIKLAADENGRPTIIDVEKDSAAERAGLRAGQRVSAIGEQPVASLGEALNRWTLTAGAGEVVSLTIAGESVPRRWTLGSVERSLPVHPAQLYSAVGAALLCWFLLAIDPLLKRDGELISLLFVLYGVMRFLEEAIRIDEPAVLGTGMSISQNISLVLIVLFGLLLAYVRRYGTLRPVGQTAG